jgi:hypothetical protein
MSFRILVRFFCTVNITLNLILLIFNREERLSTLRFCFLLAGTGELFSASYSLGWNMKAEAAKQEKVKERESDGI